MSEGRKTTDHTNAYLQAAGFLSCVIGAVIMACCGVEGWGWLVFLAVLLCL